MNCIHIIYTKIWLGSTYFFNNKKFFWIQITNKLVKYDFLHNKWSLIISRFILKCIGCVRKFAMHFGGFKTAKELFLHFVLFKNKIYHKFEKKLLKPYHFIINRYFYCYKFNKINLHMSIFLAQFYWISIK